MSMWPSVRERLGRRAPEHATETLAGLALAAWVFGRLVFVHSDVGSLPGVVTCNPMGFIQAFALAAVCVSLAAREVHMDTPGTILLGLLLVVSFAIRKRVGDSSLLALALLLAASRDMRLERMVSFGVGASVAALLFVAFLRQAPQGFAGAGREALGGLRMSDSLCVPRLLFGMLASLALIRSRRLSWMAVPLGCLAGAALCATYFHALEYALLMLLLGVCVVASVGWRDALRALVRNPAARCTVAVVPPLLCCVACDLVAYYGLDAAGAYVSFVQGYGLLATALIAILYVRAVHSSGTGPRIGMLWMVLLLYALALLSDDKAMLVEFNLPLLYLGAGLGPKAAPKGKRMREHDE